MTAQKIAGWRNRPAEVIAPLGNAFTASQLAIDFYPSTATASRLGAEAGERRRSKADDVCPGFSERALNFIADYARQHLTFTGEVATNAAVMAGIKPHDTRAFGGIYAKAIRSGVIRVVGIVPRTKGHGSAGGKLYERGVGNGR